MLAELLNCLPACPLAEHQRSSPLTFPFLRPPFLFLPSQQAILAKKRFEEEQDKEKEDQKKKLLEQYGADKFLAKKADPRLLLGQTEAWIEYSKDGRVIKGAPRAIARSKYQVGRAGFVWFGWRELGRRVCMAPAPCADARSLRDPNTRRRTCR